MTASEVDDVYEYIKIDLCAEAICYVHVTARTETHTKCLNLVMRCLVDRSGEESQTSGLLCHQT